MSVDRVEAIRQRVATYEAGEVDECGRDFAFLLGLLDEAVALHSEFRRDFTAFITAFEANDPHSADGEDLAARIDTFLEEGP